MIGGPTVDYSFATIVEPDADDFIAGLEVAAEKPSPHALWALQNR